MTNSAYRAKKRFGQHFLHERKYIEDIIGAAALHGHDKVLEVGPGLGALTDLLLPLAAEVNVIEVDRDLAEQYQHRTEQNLIVHVGDALDFAWSDVLPDPPYVFVANLPYNISSQILIKLIAERKLFKRAVLMFQKEVADRICADSNTRDYGTLSVFCQMFFDIRKVVVVPPGAFKPPPKVDSAVVHFEPLAEPRFQVNDEDFFRHIVKSAFAQRRKTLRNSLKSGGFSVPIINDACKSCNIDPVRRGETLSLSEFSELTRALSVNK